MNNAAKQKLKQVYMAYIADRLSDIAIKLKNGYIVDARLLAFSDPLPRLSDGEYPGEGGTEWRNITRFGGSELYSWIKCLNKAKRIEYNEEHLVKWAPWGRVYERQGEYFYGEWTDQVIGRYRDLEEALRRLDYGNPAGYEPNYEPKDYEIVLHS